MLAQAVLYIVIEASGSGPASIMHDMALQNTLLAR